MEYDTFFKNLQKQLQKIDKITEEQFLDHFNMMPPCRWNNLGGWEYFHSPELYSFDLACWYAYNKNLGVGISFILDKDAKEKRLKEVFDNLSLIGN